MPHPAAHNLGYNPRSTGAEDGNHGTVFTVDDYVLGALAATG